MRVSLHLCTLSKKKENTRIVALCIRLLDVQEIFSRKVKMHSQSNKTKHLPDLDVINAINSKNMLFGFHVEVDVGDVKCLFLSVDASRARELTHTGVVCECSSLE